VGFRSSLPPAQHFPLAREDKMKTTNAPSSGVRADRAPLAAWSFDPESDRLTIRDTHGFVSVFHVEQLDVRGECFELVEVGGERFGESALVLLDGRHSLCSCSPDSDVAFEPCGHAVALLGMVRARSRSPPG